jgi:hypothetical protein
MIDLITIPRFCALTGYSDDAVRAKMAEGVWLEDSVWVKAPDGRILISIRGYQAWAVGRAFDPSDEKLFRLILDGEDAATVSDFASHRRKRTSSTPSGSRR